MIKATVIQDSISTYGKRIITFELEYMRFIHAELMTHREFSRNAASSRAIPIEKMLNHINQFPATPIHWGKNQAGMSANGELEQPTKIRVQSIWNEAMMDATKHSQNMSDEGAHKQIANRITEPFQTMKVVVTSTEWDNWFWLRNHEDAQPEIRQLAKVMLEAMDASSPMVLNPDEWHVPYISRSRPMLGGPIIYSVADTEVSTEDAKMISASCCAQVSYRKSDDSIEKARMIFDRLINSVPIHASPVEHQATPLAQPVAVFDTVWQQGVTHRRRDGTLCSGNFREWVQFRQLIPNQSK